jgi:molybdate transport system substrate-binding protein
MATKPLLLRACEQYLSQRKIAVKVESIGGVDAAKRIRSGEVIDIVLLASNSIDQLIGQGFLDATIGRIDWVRSGIGMAIPDNRTVPSISNAQEVRTAVHNAQSISYSTGPSGVYLEQLFEQWGLAAEISAKMVLAPPGVPVASLVAQGVAEIGFQQLSELAGQPGIRVIGPLPPDIQLITTFSAGVHCLSDKTQDALELIRYLTSTSLTDLVKQQGMEAA